MASIKTVQEILQIARVSQYLAANDIANKKLFRGADLDSNLAHTIYMERLPIQRLYDLNPSDSTLRATANYLYALLGEYAIEAEDRLNIIETTTPPIVSGPPDQTLSISGTASFTIAVNSSSSYTVKWYRNGAEVPGQTGLTYSYAATTANNGDQVWATVTNAGGQATSRTATLTVGNTYAAYLHIGDEDEYPNIANGVDNLDYQFNTTMTVASATFDFTLTPEAANDRWQVVKWPTVWGNVTEFFSTPLNSGFVPGVEYRGIVTIGSFSYICSRNALSFESAFPLVFKRP